MVQSKKKYLNPKKLLLGCGVTATVGIILVVVGFWIIFPKLPPLFPGPNEEGGYTEEILDRWLEKTVRKNLLNGAVLVVDRDEILVKKCYGSPGPDGKGDITLDHSFRLASLSKQFTAAAIMSLQVDGKLEFDDPLSKHLPEMQWPGVTIRHLLKHTSGAPDYMWEGGKFTEENPMTIGDVVELMASKKPKFPANKKHSYSNTGYVLLAGVVERVSGKTLEAYTSERLFEPLGMRSTRVWHLASENPDFPMALGTFSRGKWKPPGALDGLAGDGGFFSNLDDLLTWDRALRKGSGFFPDDVLEEAFTRGKLSNGKSFDYGFGWVIEQNTAGQWHNGAWLGARTYLYRNPGKGQLIVVLDNAGHDVFFVGTDLRTGVMEREE